MPIGRGFQENVRLDEGLDPNGVRTVLHFEGDEFIAQRQQDLTEALKHVEEMRIRNSLRKPGDHMEVGHIPWIFLEKLDTIPDPHDRYKAKLQFLRDNPAFCAYPKFIHDSRRT